MPATLQTARTTWQGVWVSTHYDVAERPWVQPPGV